jgi:predicted site-specific integrase-resolvase
VSALLTQLEAAKRLHKDVKTIRRWTDAGIIPVFRDPDSGRPMYPEAALDKWLASFADNVKRAS